jgi:hypothetical protein
VKTSVNADGNAPLKFRFRRQSGHHDNSGKCLLLTQNGHRVPDKVQDMAQRIATVLSAQLGSKSGAHSRAFVVRQLMTLHALDLSDSQASPGRIASEVAATLRLTQNRDEAD